MNFKEFCYCIRCSFNAYDFVFSLDLCERDCRTDALYQSHIAENGGRY